MLRKDTIFGDGTFDKVPGVFYQLNTWHTEIGNSYPPCIYFLLEKKNLQTYIRMFEMLKQLLPNLIPKKILVDFEKACMIAAQAAFPAAQLKGCYFHLSQSILRKIITVGLRTEYDDQGQSPMRLQMKSLAALVFVPVEDVPRLFDELAAEFPEDDRFNYLLTYFASTYISGYAGRGPIFPIIIWNHFEAALIGAPRPTSCCEGFHNSLRAMFHCTHPGMWILLEGLKKDMAFNKNMLIDAEGSRPEPMRKKHKYLNLRVAAVAERYRNEPDKLKYLRTISNIQLIATNPTFVQGEGCVWLARS